MNWLQISAALLVVISLGWSGWIIKGKFDRAADADQLQIELDAANSRLKASIEAVKKSDRARLRESAKLETALSQLDVKTKETIRYVVKKIPDNRACDLDAGTVGLLNDLRGYPSDGSVRPGSDADVGKSGEVVEAPEPVGF